MKQTDILTGDLQLFQKLEHTCERSNKHTKDSMNMKTKGIQTKIWRVEFSKKIV